MNGLADDAQEKQRLLNLLESERNKATKLTTQLASQTTLDSPAAKLLLQNITKSLASFRKGVRELELWTEEAGGDDPASFTSLQEQQQVYSSLQQANRQASTQVQQNAAKHLREQRKALLGSPDPSAKQRQLQDSSQLLGASKDITQGLRRTKQLLSQELDHTSATLAAMDASHERLAKSKEEYEKQTPLLTKSRRLLSKMSWHSILDNLVLYGCLTIFFAVVAYIVCKRLIYFVPSFLIPSFGRAPALGQKLGQSPAGTPLSPSVGGPPSNDRWYEAQLGYDDKDRISDDQWYQAQHDDSLGSHDPPEPSAASSSGHLSVTSSAQQQQQQQRQLEEAYREAVPQPITPRDGSTHGSVRPAESGTPAAAVPAKGMPAAGMASVQDMSASQAGSHDVGLSQSGSQPDPVLQAPQPKLRDSSTQTPPEPGSGEAGIQQASGTFQQNGDAKLNGNLQQGNAVPGINAPPTASRAAVPPMSASQAELDIRKGLEQSSVPEPPRPHADSASQRSAADAGQAGDLSNNAAADGTPQDSLTDAEDSAERSQSTADKAQGSADDALLAADLEAPSAGLEKPLLAEHQAVQGQADALDTYSGLEQATYPDASEITETAAAHDSALAGDTQQNASLLEGEDPSDTPAASHNSSKPELADDDEVEPRTPSEREGARVLRTASSLADSASGEGQLSDEPDHEALLDELQAAPLDPSRQSSEELANAPSNLSSAIFDASDLGASESHEEPASNWTSRSHINGAENTNASSHEYAVLDAAEPITAKLEVELTGDKNQLDEEGPAFSLTVQNRSYTAENWATDKSSHKAVSIEAELDTRNLTAVVDELKASSPGAASTDSTDAEEGVDGSPGSMPSPRQAQVAAPADDNVPSPYDDITAEHVPEHWNLPKSSEGISENDEARSPSATSQSPAETELADAFVGSSKDGLEPESVQQAPDLQESQSDLRKEPALASHLSWIQNAAGGAVDFASGIVDSVKNLSVTANKTQLVVPESLHSNASAPLDSWAVNDQDLADRDEL